MSSEYDYSELEGFRVGDYVLDKYIDEGGQAVVFTAHLPEYPQRKYALKIFGLMQSGPRGLEVGLKEAKKLASVNHPSVVRFYKPDVDAVELKGEVHRILFLPMDFANRGNCYREPPFKDTHLSVLHLKSLIELLDGLQAIHREIFHEDIKPANILQFQELFDGEERIVLRITDFGIAKVRTAALGADTPDPSGMTLEFMSPEQADHVHEEKGDIYSMGATIYYMITGKLPIEPVGDVPSDPYSMLLAWQHAHKTQPRPNAMKHSVYCPPRLALLLMRMMSVDPKDRPDLEECKKELRRIIDTHDLALLQRLEVPRRLKEDLDRNEFPIWYVPEDFRGIFKPKIHETLGSELFIIRIKMGHPVYSQYKAIIEYMVKRLSDCFCLYETWGTYDVNMLLWGKYTDEEAVNLKRSLGERLAGSRVEIRTASKIHDFHCDIPGTPRNADPVYALAVQEGKPLPDLRIDEYLCKEFPSDLPEHSIRAFTYVAPADPSEWYIRNAIIRNVQEKLSELMEQDRTSHVTPRFRRMSMIELSPPTPALAENDTAVLAVNFVASEYKYLADVPTAIIGAVGENAVKTSSFLETRRVVVQSDKILF